MKNFGILADVDSFVRKWATYDASTILQLISRIYILSGTLQKMKPGTKQPPMSLRQSQVTLLLREMAHSAGVKIDVRHRDAHRGIALVDFLDQVRKERQPTSRK